MSSRVLLRTSHPPPLYSVWNNGSGRRKLLMVCVRANPMDGASSDEDAIMGTPAQAAQQEATVPASDAADAAFQNISTELRPEFEGEDVHRQLQRFSQFTMTRSLGRSESRRRMKVWSCVLQGAVVGLSLGF